MSSTQIAKSFIMNLLADGLVHCSQEIYESAKEDGVISDKKRSAINNALYQLKKEKLIKNGKTNREYKLVKGRKIEKEKICAESDTQKKKMDWERYVLLEPSSNKQQEPRVRINDKGEIRLNKVLIKKLETNRVELFFSKDYRAIRLVPNGSHSHVLSSNGTVRNKTIVSELEKHKLHFPVIYIVDWNEEIDVYEGIIKY